MIHKNIKGPLNANKLVHNEPPTNQQTMGVAENKNITTNNVTQTAVQIREKLRLILYSLLHFHAIYVCMYVLR